MYKFIIICILCINYVYNKKICQNANIIMKPLILYTAEGIPLIRKIIKGLRKILKVERNIQIIIYDH